MRWSTKARIQRVLSAVPGGGTLNYALQRLSGSSGPAPHGPVLFRANVALSHLASATRGGRAPGAVSAYEFGAGSDLTSALARAAAGVTSQVLVDLVPLVRPARVRESIGFLVKHQDQLDGDVSVEVLSTLDLPTSRRGVVAVLQERLGIDYRAPLDAGHTGLPAGSFDLIASNSTMEHIPAADLDALVAECRRLLAPDGVMAFRIDYEDHYAIADPGIPPYHFLRFSDAEWSRYDSCLQYQNRLRHPDYVALFDRHGLEMLEVETLGPSPGTLDALRAFPLAERFRGYSLDDLAVRKGMFVLGSS